MDDFHVTKEGLSVSFMQADLAGVSASAVLL
jgi:hypothetical protein